jgi:hypothetical protein
MALMYDMTDEGVGAQYQRIVGLLGIAKVHGLKFIHNLVTIGHNYDDDPLWNHKWDKLFNIKSLTEEININNKKIIKCDKININDIKMILKNNDCILSVKNPFDVVDVFPNIYYKAIQEEIREAYRKNNKDLSLYLFDINKKNIAIHIRVINHCDDKHEFNNYDNLVGRFDIQVHQYISLITFFKKNYPEYDIHIFSQYNIYQKYKSIMDIPNIKLHIDTDAITTFHHLSNADILVIAKSSFSYLAGIYNKNIVMYSPLQSPPLDEWKNLNDYI